MPVIKLSIPCKIQKPSSNNMYGELTLGAPVSAVCAIVKLEVSSQHTTVRTDSSATHGFADENVADAVLLLSNKITIMPNDVITVRGVTLKVVGVRHRMNVMGRIDHYEVRCTA